MNVNNLNNVSYLDRVRIDNGIKILQSTFYDLSRNNKSKAVQLLNDENLTFVCFYVLLSQIELVQISSGLSQRNLQAMQFCKQNNIKGQPAITKPVLQWIFNTSVQEENLSEEFEEVLDRSAVQLLITFKDQTILPLVTELMFRRHRQGKHMHDLAWSFFKSQDADTMPLVASYIRSENERDNQLAYKLLNFKPELQPNDKVTQYHNFHKWLDENRRFLYPTGESMQVTSAPKHWRVDLTAKYLCKDVVTTSQARANLLSGVQQKNLITFKSMEHADQKLLAKYSYKTHERDLAVWNGWMKTPIERQIIMAKAELGGAK
ncbi:MAG: hypothetical protein RR444_09545 [Oscillospiraceae bacterium]